MRHISARSFGGLTGPESVAGGIIGCRWKGLLRVVGVIAALLAWHGAAAAQQEKRFGLVIGNSEYAGAALPTAANDAGLIAQTLQASGFDVMGARDLDGEGLRNTFRDFVDKVAADGPGSVVFVYLSGHGVQYEGENYFVPVDARINRDVDVPLRALRLNDYVRPLGSLNAKAVVVVLDAARDAPFARSGQPLAGGLALVEPGNGMLWAFNAAPGTIAQPGQPPYGAYAQALAEMMREGGLSLDGVFERTRLRVHEATSGGEVPWHVSQVRAPFVFFERADDAPPEASLSAAQSRRARPIRAFDDARDAYLAALERDTLDGYIDFLRAYPDHALAKRVHAIVAARREAITWRRARNADTPEAYWSYLDRYPYGPHAPDARRRLAFLTAPLAPPPGYAAFDYDIPPPPPEELFYVRRSYVYFADPGYGFVEPPPPPLFFLPPRPRYFRPPPPPVGLYVLPVPVFVPVPVYIRQPRYVSPPPPSNVVFRNIHTPPQQQPVGGAPGRAPGAPGTGPSAGTVAAGVAAGAALGAAAATVALPPSMQRRPGAPTPGTVPGGGQPPAVSKTGIPVAPGAPLPAPAGNGAPFGKGLTPPSSASGTPQSPQSPFKAAPGTPAGAPPSKAATGTPPPAPAVKAPLQSPVTTAPVQRAPSAPQPDPRLRAQDDRAALQQKLDQDRQRELDRRRQEQEAQLKARQQNQLQDLQQQRQQQAESQRRAMEQQQAAARAAQQQQQHQQAEARQRAAQQQQQQAQAQAAAARAQAEAQARAKAAQQPPPKKCGAPGLPPCPKQ